ncbi:MAG: hypothetical protein EHM64_06835 [Ignavibacteriae bacterium]|nr:MAG: hypothetical protein EHM64_06835 [Ignavibacteriota bacterium]
MNYSVVAFILIIFVAQNVFAQEYTYIPDLKNQLIYGPLQLQDDSLPPIPKRRLLPENMSFMEKDLWGEDGVFRTMGLAAPLTPESRKRELTLRRTMLTAHQIGGFVTLSSMIMAVYFGQQVIDGKYGYRRNHSLFVTTTIISYSATGLLAVLSPPPVIRRNEISTTTIHKTLAWVHFAGMVLTPILGMSIGRHATTSQIAHFHQASGYITTAALAASLLVVTF